MYCLAIVAIFFTEIVAAFPADDIARLSLIPANDSGYALLAVPTTCPEPRTPTGATIPTGAASTAPTWKAAGTTKDHSKSSHFSDPAISDANSNAADDLRGCELSADEADIWPDESPSFRGASRRCVVTHGPPSLCSRKTPAPPAS